MWNIKSSEEEKVIALTGKVQKLSDAILKLSKYLEDKKSKKGTSKDKKKQTNKDKKWALKKKGPKPGKPWTKKYNDKTFNWCKWHKAWIFHDPKATSGPMACKLRLEEEGTSNPTPTDAEQSRSMNQDKEEVHANNL